ncbi:hypothetical protein [Streptomyces sp. NPDC012746]|uniref:hypothetical protein n=1 Tax=Streptomyces sp. NPDC012746 TaxID=3364845 RepID=UPI0036CFBBA2
MTEHQPANGDTGYVARIRITAPCECGAKTTAELHIFDGGARTETITPACTHRVDGPARPLGAHGQPVPRPTDERTYWIHRRDRADDPERPGERVTRIVCADVHYDARDIGGTYVVTRVYGGEHVITTRAYAAVIDAVRAHRHQVEITRRAADQRAEEPVPDTLTATGSTPSHASNPVVRAALAALHGLPLADVAEVIDSRSTGYYVRPLPLTDGLSVSVRWVNKGILRPANAQEAHERMDRAAQALTRAGWTVVQSYAHLEADAPTGPARFPVLRSRLRF